MADLVGVATASDFVGVTGFAITAGDPGVLFAIDNSGLVTVASDLSAAAGQYVLTIEASDAANNIGSGTITIDVIGDTPVIDPGQTFAVTDNAVVADLVGTVTASDDIAVTGFAITAGDPGALFAIDNTGALTVANSLAAATGQHVLTIEATDAQSNIGTETITIDVNPSTGLVPGAVLILEGDSGASSAGWVDASGNGNDLLSSGSPALTTSPMGVTAVDFDGIDDAYDRVGGLTGLPTGNADRTVFMVGAYDSAGFGGFAWGEPASLKAFGLIVNGSGNLAVQAWGSKDMNSTTQATGAGWLVQSAVVDANVATHYANGTLIGAASRTYQTTNTQIVLGAEIDGSPNIDMTVGAIVVYDRALTPAERTQVETYLADKYIGSDTTAPLIDSGQAFSIAETAAVSDLVGTVTASDAVGVTGFAIAAGDAGGLFAIDAAGVVTVASDLSAAPGQYILTIEASDSASNVGTETIAIDVIGTTPVIDSGQAFAVANTAATSDAVGVVTASDDIGVTGFAITAGDPGALFAIDNTGALTVANSLAAATGQHVLTIEASDAQTNIGTETITIDVIPDTTAPVIDAGQSFAADDTSLTGDVLGTVTAADDVGVTGFVIVAGDLGGLFTIDNAGVLTAATDLAGAVGQYVLTVDAVDAAANVGTETVVVDVATPPDLEPPTIQSDQVLVVPDTALPTDIVGSVAITDNVGVTTAIISAGDPAGLFAIDTSGGITVVGSLAGATGRYDLAIEAGDASANTSTAVVSVDVFSTAALPAAPVLHLEADIGVSGTTGVTGWRDLSGNGNDLTAVGNPTRAFSPGGEDIIDFDGIDDALERVGSVTALPTGSTDRTAFVVGSFDGVGWGGAAWGTSATNRTFGLIVDGAGNLAVQAFGANDMVSATPGTGQGWLVQSAVVEADVVEHYLDGALIDTGSRTYNTADDRIVVGAEVDGVPSIDMSVGAVLVYDRALTPAERVQVETYLATKYIIGGPDTDAPVITPAQEFAVLDTAQTGDILGTVEATDNLGVATFSIIGGDPTGIFSIDSGGVLTVLDPLQLVAPSVLSLQIEAADGSANTAIETVTVTVNNGTGLPSGAVLVLEADSGVVTSSGDVLTWVDQSGNGNDLNAAGTPIVGTSPTGAPAIELDGITDSLTRAAPTLLPAGPSDRTVIVVGEHRSSGWGGLAWGQASSNHMFGVGVDSFGDYAVQGWGTSNDFGSAISALGQGWNVQTTVLNASTLSHSIDGAVIDTQTHTFDTIPSDLVLGVSIDGSVFLDMSIGAVVVYDRALTPAEQAQAEAYLVAKYTN